MIPIRGRSRANLRGRGRNLCNRAAASEVADMQPDPKSIHVLPSGVHGGQVIAYQPCGLALAYIQSSSLEVASR
jgi:hypothetical protein